MNVLNTGTSLVREHDALPGGLIPGGAPIGGIPGGKPIGGLMPVRMRK